MTDNKNLILAIVLSAVVLFGWTFIAERMFPTANPRSTVIKGGEELVVPKPSADPAADAPAAVQSREQVLASTPRIPIRTPRLTGSLNVNGARIDDLVLTGYKESIGRDSPLIRLLSPSGAPSSYFASFGFAGGAGVPGPDTRWQASGDVLAPGQPVTLSWNNELGQTFQIVLSVDNDYLFSVEHRILNRGPQAAVARPYSLIARTGQSPDADNVSAHVGPVGVFNDSHFEENWDDLREAEAGELTYSSQGGWLGFSDKYWLTALIPDQRATASASLRHGAGDRFQADLTRDPLIAAPGSAAAAQSRFFAGAKEVDLLDRYRDELDIPQLDEANDWGTFHIIAKPIFDLLHYLFRVLGNFGLAIIALTLIVRLVLFPIANRQYASMNKMRALAPKLKELQERFKDDRAGMQQAMLKLYQTEKVNPVGGCLPILLQIPIFFALYKVLLLSIEMRHQPFALWIRDLSAPDPLTPLNFFGLLPFQPPAFIAIGVLPIFLGVTMWLQQKLNPQPLDPVQAKVFGIMPWIFMFIMAPFAAGLQLYWATNNVLSIAQQWLLMRRHPMPAVPARAK